MADNIHVKLIEEEMKSNYIDYSMSVIVGRALPDIRDGLKPVHRRILFSMYDMGLFYNKSFVKSARIVGECFKYHPHGDAAIYDSLVRMAQDFSLRYKLIKGHGNFGTKDFVEPAHMRYTEAKLSKIAEELLSDIEKETVDFIPNFDGSLKEPVVLPSKIPNLLINGSSGIAVGMATNIPPHNINEICELAKQLIDNPQLEYSQIYNIVKGPDFPTGAQIIGTAGIRNAYKTGRGKIIIRAKTTIEENKIIINEIPYQVNKSTLIEGIADQVKEKIIEGISDIRDESDKEGIRIVIELRKNSNPEIILNQLYKNSQLQISFGIINLALVNGEPKILNIKDTILEFIKHRKEVVTKRTKYDLKKAEERDHILQGLLIALRSIDEIIKLIKSSKDISEARYGLINNYVLSEIQANAILDMKLSRLAALEQQKILDEHNELLKFILEMKDILANEVRIFTIIKDELIGIKNEFGDKRKTEIIENEEDIIETEDMIENEKVVVTLTHSGYIKRQSLDVYKAQRRGGKGIIGTETKDEQDFVEQLFVTTNHSYLLLFTDKGIIHWLKAYQVPESGRYAKGSSIVNLIKLEANEKLAAIVSVEKFDNTHFLIMGTKNGIIKKTSLEEYSHPRAGGIIGINLRENDKLIDVKITDGNKQIIMATKDGRAARFSEKNVNSVGRNSIGVRGINVKKSEVIGMEVINSPYILTITENGYGKRTNVEEYRLINRGGSGVTNIKITEKNGKVVKIKIIDEQDELMLISKNGVIIRTPVTGISVIGRNTQGVKIMNLDQNDKVATVEKIIGENIEVIENKEEYKPSEDANDVIEEIKLDNVNIDEENNIEEINSIEEENVDEEDIQDNVNEIESMKDNNKNYLIDNIADENNQKDKEEEENKDVNI